MSPICERCDTLVTNNLPKGTLLSISDQIVAAIGGKSDVQQKFIDWMDELPEGDRLYIDGVLVNGDVSVGTVHDILVQNGAPVTRNRLYDYRRTLLPKRVKG